MTAVKITRLNQSYDKISCEPSISYDIRNFFTFQVPNAKFSPMTKFGWDGTIKLFDVNKHILPAGLRNDLIEFLEDNDYEFEIDELNSNTVTLEILREWSKTLNLPSEIVPDDYQLQAIIEAEKNRRNLFLSATSSGKTLIAYLLYRWFKPKQLLIVVTRKALAVQFIKDFKEYGCTDNVVNVLELLHQDQETHLCINWQAIFRKPSQWFEKFDMIIGDECQNFAAKSLNYILNSCTNTEKRYGLSGSLSGAKIHEMVLKGHFGQIVTLSTSKELMKKGRISNLKINIIILKHKEEDRKFLAKKDNREYNTEIQFLENCKSRNNFLINLLIQQQKNSFLLFKHISHGELLHNMIMQKKIDKRLFYVAGSGEMKISVDEAEQIRYDVDHSEESITLASLLYFSEGTNIKNINDVIFGISNKSRIKVMQSIGRGLRKDSVTGKNSAILWDIADDLKYKKRTNHTLKHLYERIKYYDEEGWDWNIFEIEL